MKNFKSVSWKFIYYKIFKIKKKIKNTAQKPRLCRNFQRLFRRTSFIQLFVISEILEIQLKKQKKDYKIFFDLNKNLNNCQKIFFSKLIQTEYCYILTLQIEKILWILVLLPIFEKKEFLKKILTGQSGLNIYKMLYTLLKKYSIKYIFRIYFLNFFSQKNKYWILSNVLIEKKFFFYWLKKDEHVYSNFFLLEKNKIKFSSLNKIFIIFTLIEIFSKKINKETNIYYFSIKYLLFSNKNKYLIKLKKKASQF